MIKQAKNANQSKTNLEGENDTIINIKQPCFTKNDTNAFGNLIIHDIEDETEYYPHFHVMRLKYFKEKNEHSNFSCYCDSNNDNCDHSSVLTSFDYFDYKYLFNHQCFGGMKVCPRDYFNNNRQSIAVVMMTLKRNQTLAIVVMMILILGMLFSYQGRLFSYLPFQEFIDVANDETLRKIKDYQTNPFSLIERLNEEALHYKARLESNLLIGKRINNSSSNYENNETKDDINVRTVSTRTNMACAELSLFLLFFTATTTRTMAKEQFFAPSFYFAKC